MSDDFDIVEPPNDRIEIERAATGHGWAIKFDGQTMAFFSTAADLASWLKTTLTTLDIEAGVIPRPELRTHENEPLPSILHENPAQLIEKKPGRLWRVFAGGRS